MLNASQVDKILPKSEGGCGERWSKLSALQKKGFESLTAKQRSSFYVFYFWTKANKWVRNELLLFNFFPFLGDFQFAKYFFSIASTLIASSQIPCLIL